jgi:hypothetical protein
MQFFEPIGRFFFQSGPLRRNRLPFFFLLLIVPFLFLSFFLTLRFFSLRDMENQFDAALLRGRAALERRALKEQFLQRYTGFEPYYINQTLESLVLLSKELKERRLLLQHPLCYDREATLRRIAFLEGIENRLTFAEENVRSSKTVKETEEKLIHPVEIDGDDLDHLLSLIEGVPIGNYTPHPHSPQLLIQDFLLVKKPISTYELNFSMVKREFTGPHAKKN